MSAFDSPETEWAYWLDDRNITTNETINPETLNDEFGASDVEDLCKRAVGVATEEGASTVEWEHFETAAGELDTTETSEDALDSDDEGAQELPPHKTAEFIQENNDQDIGVDETQAEGDDSPDEDDAGDEDDQTTMADGGTQSARPAPAEMPREDLEDEVEDLRDDVDELFEKCASMSRDIAEMRKAKTADVERQNEALRALLGVDDDTDLEYLIDEAADFHETVDEASALALAHDEELNGCPEPDESAGSSEDRVKVIRRHLVKQALKDSKGKYGMNARQIATFFQNEISNAWATTLLKKAAGKKDGDAPDGFSFRKNAGKPNKAMQVRVDADQVEKGWIKSVTNENAEDGG